MFSKSDSAHTSDELVEMNLLPYRNLIRCHSFIARRMRSDIMYSLNEFSQFQVNLGIKNWHSLQKFLGYLQCTQNFISWNLKK